MRENKPEGWGVTEENREHLQENFLKAAERFRDEYIDDLPETLVTSNDPNYQRYKCRSNYFNNVCMFLGLVLKEGFLQGTQTEQNAIDFIDYYTRVRPKGEGLFYTREDI